MTDTQLATRPAPPTQAASPIPGLIFCALGAIASVLINHWVPSVSALLVAILLGAILANLRPLPTGFAPGIAISSRRLLRLGIVLLGLNLLLTDVLALGWAMILVVIAIVGIGLLTGIMVGRALGLSPTQSLLIACGFSICGAAAVAAADGVLVDESTRTHHSARSNQAASATTRITSKEEEVVTAVALVVIFGTIMIPLIPLLSHLLGLSSEQAGLWAGGSIHEVAQVVAAGGIISGGALAVAVVVKLARVLMLAPVMTIIAVRQRRKIGDNPAIRKPPLVPLFVIGFCCAVAVRSFGLIPVGWLGPVSVVQTFLLAAAMFALGTGVRISTLRGVGLRPFVLGAIVTAVVSAVSLGGVLLTHP
ncbi:YeiH family protein [Devriesea agamarum]|uniref:YeiH family protein n=1 Tax=Devriesea agamarum TaxID=472569 RepID=UPI00071DC379|nr:putative sulfate exporter family transporter [Devriesea agamarum]